MPDFTVQQVMVNVKGKLVEQQCLHVNHLVDIICDEIAKFFDARILVPSSQHTCLDDNTIMLCFMGDKGGTFMASKFGLTVMNYMNPNSPDVFNVCATVDAPDTYYNLKVGIFDYYEDELEFFFNMKTGTVG